MAHLAFSERFLDQVNDYQKMVIWSDESLTRQPNNQSFKTQEAKLCLKKKRNIALNIKIQSEQ